MKIIHIQAGDVLTMKKPHPCGQCDFDVLRAGSDVRVRCHGCGRDMVLPRDKIEKSIKKVNGIPV